MSVIGWLRARRDARWKARQRPGLEEAFAELMDVAQIINTDAAYAVVGNHIRAAARDLQRIADSLAPEQP